MKRKSLVFLILVLISTTVISSYACTFSPDTPGVILEKAGEGGRFQDVYSTGCGEAGCAETEVCQGSKNEFDMVVGSCVEANECKKPDENRYFSLCDSLGNCGPSAGCGSGERCKETAIYTDGYWVEGARCVEDSTCGEYKDVCRARGTCGGERGDGGLIGDCEPGTRCSIVYPQGGWGYEYGNSYYDCVPDDTCDEEAGLCGGFGQPCCEAPKAPCNQDMYATFTFQMQCCPSGVCAPNCNSPVVGGDGNLLIKTLKDLKYKGPFLELNTLFSGASGLLTYASVLLGVIFIVIAGYKYMTSEGDPRKAKEAQEDIAAVISGILFVLLASALMNIILSEILGI